MKSNCVYLVGSGPGNPDLLTVKAHRLISEAKIVVCDRLVSDEIRSLIPLAAEVKYVGKEAGKKCVSQEEINEILVDCSKISDVVRLKGGDPFIFGRGGEEALYLYEKGVEFDVVPGITSASGCSSALGIPLTHRNLATSVRYITGHRQKGKQLDLDWSSLADENTTIVVYMGLKNIDEISGNLIDAGLSHNTPAVVIENGTTPIQRHVFTNVGDLWSDVKLNCFSSPSLVIIGKVVSLSNQDKI